jgi:hypothetical protein
MEWGTQVKISPVALAQQILAAIHLAIYSRVHSQTVGKTECKLSFVSTDAENI